MNEYFVAVVTVDDIVDYIDGLDVDLVYEEQDAGLSDRLVNLFGVDKAMVDRAIETQRTYQLSLTHEDSSSQEWLRANLSWDYESV